jgi:hypothetical protein
MHVHIAGTRGLKNGASGIQITHLHITSVGASAGKFRKIANEKHISLCHGNRPSETFVCMGWE